MKSSKELRERLGELHDAATALVNLAKKDDRDLTDEEHAQFQAYKTESEDIKANKLPDAEWLEDEEDRIAQTRSVGLQGGGAAPQGQPSKTDFGRPVINIPKKTLFWKNRLKAFKGENGLEDALLTAHFYAATLFESRKSREWCEKHDIDVQMALSEDSLEKGGALVPDETEARIVDLAEQYGTARRKCEIVPMGSDTKSWPRVTSGLTVYYPGEGQTITASDIGTDQIKLVAKKPCTLTKISTELDEDSMVALADLITRKIALAFATAEDKACFLGDSTSTYGHISGLITECAAATATVSTAATANTAYSTLDLTDFEEMVGMLPEFPGIEPEWYIHKAGWAASMMRLADAAGGNTVMNIEGRGMTMLVSFCYGFHYIFSFHRIRFQGCRIS